MHLRDLIVNFRWQDAADIAVVAVLIYWLVNLIRGTRAAAMLLGLLSVWGVYFLAQRLELLSTFTILHALLSQILLIIVVIFRGYCRAPAGRMRRARGRGCRLGDAEWVSGDSPRAERPQSNHADQG